MNSTWCILENTYLNGDNYLTSYDDPVNIYECMDICDGLIHSDIWDSSENYTMCNYIEYEIEQFSSECSFYEDIDSIDSWSFDSYDSDEYHTAYRSGDENLGDCPTPSPTQSSSSNSIKPSYLLMTLLIFIFNLI